MSTIIEELPYIVAIKRMKYLEDVSLFSLYHQINRVCKEYHSNQVFISNINVEVLNDVFIAHITISEKRYTDLSDSD